MRPTAFTLLAEGVGFEPTSDGDTAATRFRVARLRPLGHPSGPLACLAPRARLERATLRLGGGCSIQLSYRGALTNADNDRRLNGTPAATRTRDLWLRRPALYPPELRAHRNLSEMIAAFSMVRPARFERATFGSGDRRSIQLSYGRAPTKIIPKTTCSMAERAGFEPARELAPPTRLAGGCLRPLGHLSATAYILPCRPHPFKPPATGEISSRLPWATLITTSGTQPSAYLSLLQAPRTESEDECPLNVAPREALSILASYPIKRICPNRLNSKFLPYVISRHHALI